MIALLMKNTKNIRNLFVFLFKFPSMNIYENYNKPIRIPNTINFPEKYTD